MTSATPSPRSLSSPLRAGHLLLAPLLAAVLGAAASCSSSSSSAPATSAAGAAGGGASGSGGASGGGGAGSGGATAGSGGAAGGADLSAEAAKLLTGPDWYRHAVFYEVNVRSFQDSNADGIGDLPGLTSRLDYLKDLGVDALWLMPIMPTAFKDSGYDVSDYQAINPDYGTLADFDALVAGAKQRNMRVMIDLVLNHTSDQHAWFQDSKSSKSSARRDWYIWSDTASDPNIGCGLYQPSFGTSAWGLDKATNQFYFHRFYAQQPDLNYRNPAVVQATLDAAKFWLDRGVDGFRCDVIGLLVESASACELIPETRDYIRKLRQLLDGYPDPKAMVAEPASENMGDPTPYFGTGSDMFHMAFNFGFGYFWGLAFKGTPAKTLANAFAPPTSEYPQGAQDALVIGSHDVVRAYVSAQGMLWRQQRAAEIQMTMRGTPFIYYGEELSLRPGKGVVVDMRDSARTPMTWTTGDGHGFSTAKPWLDFGADPDLTSVDTEAADPSSMLSFYKSLLAFRRGHAVWGAGTARVISTDNDSVFVYAREGDSEAFLVAENMSDQPQTANAPDPKVPGAGAKVRGDGSFTLDASGGHITIPASGSLIVQVR